MDLLYWHEETIMFQTIEVGTLYETIINIQTTSYKDVSSSTHHDWWHLHIN